MSMIVLAFGACDSDREPADAVATGGNAATGGVPAGGTANGGRAAGGAAKAGASGNGGTSASGGTRAGGMNSGGATGGSQPNGGGSAGKAPGQGGTSDGGENEGGSSAAGGGGIVEPDGAITAVMAASSMGRGVNLGQMFENTQHRPTLAVARPKIDAYYAKGFRNLRIPVTWTEPVQGDRLVNDATVGDVNRQHARLAEPAKVIDYALAMPGMYVIVNAHHERALKNEARAAVLERLWADIADIFANRSHRLLFEILNEPHRSDDSAMAADELRSMTGKAYAKIRAVDPERIIIIGGNQWFAAREMAQVWPDLAPVGGGDDPYLMATFHHYDPWTFCGDNQEDYSDSWSEENLSEPMEIMLSWADSVGGVPVYIGEWGVGWGSRYDVMDCNNIRRWYEQMDKVHAAPKGIPTSVWDDGGWFEIFDFASNDFANNLVDCISGACAWNGDERFNEACF